MIAEALLCGAIWVAAVWLWLISGPPPAEMERRRRLEARRLLARHERLPLAPLVIEQCEAGPPPELHS